VSRSIVENNAITLVKMTPAVPSGKAGSEEAMTIIISTRDLQKVGNCTYKKLPPLKD
jgi:hypothetical protein